MDTNEPGAAVLNLFDQIIQRVKQTQPMRSDDKPLKGGRVYSMMALGMPVDPDDYDAPWNPQGATPNLPAAPPPVPVPGTTASGSAATDPNAPPPPPTISPEAARELKAAFNISQLGCLLLSVTDDQTYEEYPDGRHMDYAYPAILTGMHPISADEPQDPAVVAAVAKANKILYQPNPDGTPSTNPTTEYLNYQNNSQLYGTAVGNYATAYAIAREDPNQMAVFPVSSKPLQMAITQARQTLISQGAAEIEGALDALATVGYPYQAHMVAAAQASYQDWSVQLAGAVAASSPYCQILPSDWASIAPGACRGWETLEVNQMSYNSYSVSHSLAQSQYSWFNKASSVGGSAGASFMGIVSLSGGASSASSSQGSQSSAGQQSSNKTYTDAKGLNIKLSYALCTIQRPWFAGDLFYMQDWYLNGALKNSISTGNIEDQIKNQNQLLPMVPQQILVVRDVSITCAEWGSVRTELENSYGATEQGSSTSSNSQAGSAGVSLGFLHFGGSASHASSKAQGQGSSVSAANSSNSLGTTFNGSTLSIPGAQILGFLCDITPAAAPVDDPQYGKTAAAATSSSGTTSPTTGTSSSSTPSTSSTPALVGAGS